MNERVKQAAQKVHALIEVCREDEDLAEALGIIVGQEPHFVAHVLIEVGLWDNAKHKPSCGSIAKDLAKQQISNIQNPNTDNTYKFLAEVLVHDYPGQEDDEETAEESLDEAIKNFEERMEADLAKRKKTVPPEATKVISKKERLASAPKPKPARKKSVKMTKSQPSEYRARQKK